MVRDLNNYIPFVRIIDHNSHAPVMPASTKLTWATGIATLSPGSWNKVWISCPPIRINAEPIISDDYTPMPKM